MRGAHSTQDFTSPMSNFYTVPGRCSNCGWSGIIKLNMGTEAPNGSLGGRRRSCHRCGCSTLTSTVSQR